MNGKQIIWGGMIVGSSVGSFLPYFWNGDFMAYTIWGAVGGILGIWAGFKLAKATGAL